jgi:hypothetical protein
MRKVKNVMKSISIIIVGVVLNPSAYLLPIDRHSDLRSSCRPHHLLDPCNKLTRKLLRARIAIVEY